MFGNSAKAGCHLNSCIGEDFTNEQLNAMLHTYCFALNAQDVNNGVLI
jgi:hypothetical protein